MTANAKKSLQIQAVLYRNDPSSVIQSLHKLSHAIRCDRDRDGFLGEVRFVWGDASPSPIFSTDQIDALAAKYAPTLTLSYHFFDENTGYGKGHNRLASGCTADYLMVENPDILVTSDYFHHMLLPFATETTGLVEARQTPVEHPKQYDEKTLETPWSSGACFIMPTELFLSLGGFDDKSFFMYSEDVDLSLRIRQKGKRLIYQPAAPVYHAKRLDGEAHLIPSPTELRHSSEAQLVLAYKWNKPQLLRRMLAHFENGNEAQRQAAAAFHRRVNAHELTRLHRKTDLFREEDFENRFHL